MPSVQFGTCSAYPQPETKSTPPLLGVTPTPSTPPETPPQPEAATPAVQPQAAPTQTPGQAAQQEGQQAVNGYKKDEPKPPRLSLFTGYSFSPNYSGSVDGAHKFKAGVGYNLYKNEIGPGKFKLDAGLGVNHTRYQAEVTDPATGYTKVKDKATFGVDLDLKAKYEMKITSFNEKRNYLFVTPTAMGGVGVDTQGKFNYQYGGGATVGVASKSGWSFGVDANYTNKGGFVGGTVVMPLNIFGK